MRIITWNCNGALRRKFDRLVELEADVFIIQECENPETTLDKKYKDWAKNCLWIGDNKNRGLGIFTSEKVSIKKLNWASKGLRYFIPCRINDSFNLLGAWCCNAPTFGYIGQLWKYLQLHKTKLDSCIIAGDLNSNVFWDKKRRLWNHSDVVRILKELSIESVYHIHHEKQHGKEHIPTYFFQKNLNKPYHIDYIFASDKIFMALKEIIIGPPDTWIGMSDHMPLLCEF